jgi:archaemetzincin
MYQLRFFLTILFLTANFACENKVVVDDYNQVNNSQTAVKSRLPVKASENLIKAMKAVEPFFEPMRPPDTDEWLATVKEDGQTFEQYINCDPILPSLERKTLYIQPIGEFNDKQFKVIRLSADYMEKFFDLPVKLLPRKKFETSLSLKNYRINQFTKNRQIYTDYILEKILLPDLPQDAASLIAFTNEDLFPDKNVNYVFGQASLKNRVGVWSLFRLDDYASPEQFLRRMLKTAVHETGHMFSFEHCTKYECVMSGVNNLGEMHKRPIDACPECMAKICWMSGYKPQKRYENLAEFCRTNKMRKDFDEFSKKAVAVSKN